MKAYYDLHIHSCLSPCASDEMTPNNIVNMAELSGLSVIAVTDHNSVLNAEPVMELAEKKGILCIPGMELSTAEDIHVICLFERLFDAKNFGKYVMGHMPQMKNKTHIFGNQVAADIFDRPILEYPYLLSVATKIKIDDVVKALEPFHGIAYPAHIDRPANGVISTLGVIPAELGFKAVEISCRCPENFFDGKKYLSNYNRVYASDAHALDQIREAGNFFELEELTIKSVFGKIIGKPLKFDNA